MAEYVEIPSHVRDNPSTKVQRDSGVALDSLDDLEVLKATILSIENAFHWGGGFSHFARQQPSDASDLRETAKQPTESSDGSIGTKHQKCLRSNLVSAGPKTSEYVSRRRWASEFLGCTLTWVDSISTYLVWNSKRLDFIWKTLVVCFVQLCFIVFHVDILGISMLFQTRYVSSASSQVLKTRLARSSGSPPYAQKLLQGWVPAFQTLHGTFFQTFLVIFSYISCEFFVHFLWSVKRRGFCAQRWFDRTRCVQRPGGNTVPEHQKVSSEVTESVPSPAKKMDIVRIVHIILHIVTFLQMWNRKILGIFLICLLRKVNKIAAESVAWFQANLPAMQNGDCQPTHWVGEANYRWTYRIHVSISPCQTFTDILSEVGPHQPCFHEIEHSESFKPFGFFLFFFRRAFLDSTYWIKVLQDGWLRRLVQLAASSDASRCGTPQWWHHCAAERCVGNLVWCIIESPVTRRDKS